MGSGYVEADILTGDTFSTEMREPATGGSGVRQDGSADMSAVGRQGKEGLKDLPKDATK